MTDRKVPFFNYPQLFCSDEQNLTTVITDVCRRGAYILQSDLAEFEQEAATFLGVKHFLGVADGSNALVLALMAAGIKPGDEVILPSHTFIAAASAVKFVGATPVLVECGKDHLIDPKSALKAINGKTRCLLPVHLNGRTCEMEPILETASKFELKIVEDAAQAFGSKYRGTAAGAFGSAGTISFYPAKVLGCLGDGGGILTNDSTIYESIYALRDHGRARNGEIVGWGTNSRLNNLQAAVLKHRLSRYPQEISRRREIAGMYQSSLGDLAELTLPPPPCSESPHFDIYQNYELEAERRDELKSYLQSRGIGTLIQWGKAIHHHTALEFSCELPVTDALFRRCLMIPMNTTLSDLDVENVIQAIKQFYHG